MARPKSIDINNPEVKTQVELFGQLCATQQEMADWFDCTLRTIEREMSVLKDEGGKPVLDDNGNETISEFCRVYKKAQAKSKTSLRRIQMSKALEGDNVLLIWLGKQLLNQKDRQDFTSGDKPISMPITAGESNL